jgi:hypothetical protein
VSTTVLGLAARLVVRQHLASGQWCQTGGGGHVSHTVTAVQVNPSHLNSELLCLTRAALQMRVPKQCLMVLVL